MSRKILAVVFGIVVAFVLIITIEALGHTVYPVPDGLDLTNPEALKAYVMDAPIAALLLVLGTVINLISIPRPLWFSMTSIVAIIATIFVTSRLGSTFVAAPDAD